ncbi:MAG TPA: hypothetical protein PKE03_09390, partial [Bacteroidales bacterium]|nr:hypothetical protein [Bacteroidales bacterium]
FAVGLEGGMRYMFNPGMGVKLSANVFFPLLDVGSFLWWSSGGGTQVGVNSSIPFAQFGLFGGIIVKPAQLMD